MNKITFFLSGPVVPKARPRVTRTGAYMPERYRDWRDSAEKEILRQVKLQGLESMLPVQRAGIEVRLTGKHRMNGDADNILGSYLDALVAVGVLKNDNLSCLPEVSLKFSSEGIIGANITLTLLPEIVAIKKNKTVKKKIAI